MIPAIATGRDALDVGRYPTTLAEIEARFVTDAMFAASTTRAKIWDEWKVATDYLRAQIPVVAVWIGGSFTTTKVDPDDVDCLYVIDAAQLAIASADPAKAAIIGNFARGKMIRNTLGWQVDTYICVWRPVPNPAIATQEDHLYYHDRGHWDDWWQRQRMAPSGAPYGRDDTLPRRGYLEVILDGF
ncbi:MAG TPA: hypothetical protein VGM45_08825 [Gaiellaceae bacterium]